MKCVVLSEEENVEKWRGRLKENVTQSKIGGIGIQVCGGVGESGGDRYVSCVTEV